MAGTAALSVAKILDNMELGHNILHGQWDWMRDPKIHSTTWEWDHAVARRSSGRRSHNYEHHTFTNVRGKDRDLGYAIMRVTPEQEWKPADLLQPLYNIGLSLIFEWGVAIYDIELDRRSQEGTKPWREAAVAAQDDLAQGPHASSPRTTCCSRCCPGPGFAEHAGRQRHRQRRPQHLVARGDLLRALPGRHRDVRRGPARRARPRGSGTSGSCWARPTSTGSPLFHIMTGNLSHQIEHHLFPDVPSNRYAEIAPRVREICERYGLPYTAGPLPRQYGKVLRKIARLALPRRRATATRPRDAAPGRRGRHRAR